MKSRFVVAFFVLFFIDTLVFQSGFYVRFLYRRSLAGLLAQRVWLVKSATKHRHSDLVACIGDSRIRHAFSARVFDELDTKHSLTALNLGLPGSLPRDWFYFLEKIDPDRQTFKYIVIALSSYWDEDWPENNQELQDAYLLLPILGFSNSGDFLNSFGFCWNRVEATLVCLFKMYGYHEDVANLLINPGNRLANYAEWKANWYMNEYHSPGDPRTLAGIKVVAGKVVGTVPETEKSQLQAKLFRPSQDPKFESYYLDFWLQRIVHRYAQSKTKILIVHIPSAPLPMQTKQPHIDSAISAVSKNPNVIVDAENDFDSLAMPENFYDNTHMNSQASRIFTGILFKRITDLPQN